MRSAGLLSPGFIGKLERDGEWLCGLVARAHEDKVVTLAGELASGAWGGAPIV